MIARAGRGLRLAAAVSGLCVVLGLTGCGGTTSVTGKVTYDGKPVVWGGVTLVDSSGQYHTGVIGLDGAYKIDNVPTGPVKIGVISRKPPDDKDRGGKAGGKGGGRGANTGGIDDPRAKFQQENSGSQTPDPPTPPPGAWFPVPDKFAEPTTSGLNGAVTAGQPLNIDLPK